MIANDPKIETAALTGSTSHAVNIKSLPLSEDPAIQRIRKRIIIIAGILLVSFFCIKKIKQSETHIIDYFQNLSNNTYYTIGSFNHT